MDGIKRDKILAIIESIRTSHCDIEYMYLMGQCYNFTLIMKAIFPETQTWYCQLEGHAYAKIDGEYFDIRGHHETVPSTICKLDEMGGDPPENWGPRDTRRLLDVTIDCTCNNNGAIVRSMS